MNRTTIWESLIQSGFTTKIYLIKYKNDIDENDGFLLNVYEVYDIKTKNENYNNCVIYDIDIKNELITVIQPEYKKQVIISISDIVSIPPVGRIDVQEKEREIDIWHEEHINDEIFKLKTTGKFIDVFYRNYGKENLGIIARSDEKESDHYIPIDKITKLIIDGEEIELK